MSDKKRYLITAVTLGCIAMGGALLIGGTNLLTRERIKQNEINAINKGIATIFHSESAKYESKVLEGEHKYLQELYVVKDNENQVGYAYKTSGSNMYGKITLLVGFDNATQSFIGTSVIVNEQTYASTLVDKYLNPLNEGTRDLDDVSCGATYGAKLVREMVNEALDNVKELWS